MISFPQPRSLCDREDNGLSSARTTFCESAGTHRLWNVGVALYRHLGWQALQGHVEKEPSDVRVEDDPSNKNLLIPRC